MNKKNISQAIGFYSIYPLLWFISLMPLRILYGLSDLCFVLVAAIGYRRKVITSNLHKAFPQKSDKEIRRIRVKFYRHFCDLVIETVCLHHINPKKILKRVEFVDVNLVNNSTRKGKDVIAVVAHYGCWEWVASINLLLDADGFSVYRPLKNSYFDKYMIKLRSIFKSANFPLNNTVREIVKMRQANRRFVIGLISDQSPSKFELHYWTEFLTQDTPIILGPEKLSRMINADLFYWQMEKIKRGKYRITAIPFPKDVKTSEEFEPTEWHVRLLEKQIIQKPEYWLWSHKRWKYQNCKKNDK